MKPLLLLLCLNFFKPSYTWAQLVAPAVIQNNLFQPKADSVHVNNHSINQQNRVYLIAGVHVAGYAGTLLILSSTWYNGYAKTSFHTFNDSKEWMQMDKIGHAWTAYNIANYSAHMWQWAGLNPDKATLFSGASALGYQTILEFLDAHSAAWGWSWADMGANTFGAALFTSQQLAWRTQKVALKFSSFPHPYHASLQPRVDTLFGNSFPERLLKDYNAQTYWLSMNLASFFPDKFPAWLNLGVGYGAKGMYGGFKNIAVDKNGAVTFDRSDIPRVRQWYLSPDIDWTKLKTNKKLVRTLFSLLNMIKIPAPAIELSGGKIKPHWLSF